MIEIALDPTTEKRLDALASRTGRPASFIVQEAIEELLEELDDIDEAERRLATPGPRLSAEEVKRELDL
jgi:RHH-type transcriptional regulator, rel operon repressor / antitoxin RelB